MNPYLIGPEFIIIAVTMIYASFRDHKTRSVPFLLFFPGMAVSVAVSVLTGQLILSMFASILFFIIFLDADSIIYLAGVSIISVTGFIIMSIYSDFSGMVTWLFMIMLAFMGYREILFGKGDIKGIITIMFSLNMLYITISPYVQIPVSMLFFMNTGISSAVAFIWAMYCMKRTAGSIGFMAPYSGDIDPVKFRKFERRGKTMVSYNIPFMIFITIAYFFTLASYLAGFAA